ncbi:uncharacterized protein E0L32_001347 [Thyridium curvatum]|uniref:BHLH domain-containing protein n=1 Tax=Thyridium curvatum TaxID=1093900 RepID=A0A507B0T0_9PEZI|nr:uncharacterized protein E0L32_001347 [Thyridium curvatum]TPX10150.1 hypothetical protein E0L32_001347 [Thyridium curvatum]
MAEQQQQQENGAIFGDLDSYDSGFAGSYLDDNASLGTSQPVSATDPGTVPPTTTTTSTAAATTNGNTPQSFFPTNASWASFQDTPPYEFDFGGSVEAFNPQLLQQAWNLQQAPQFIGHLPQRPHPQSLNGISPASINADSLNSPLGPNSSFSGSEAQVRPHFSADILSTLTPAQQEKLKSIAMPAHLQYHSPKSEPSPQSSINDKDKGDLASSPDDPTKNRKRKSSADDEDDDDDDDENQPIKKTAHNMIEKRYRTNLNDKIAALRDSVPSLRIMSKSARGEDTTEDREELHGLTPAHKLNKATVLSKATEYIRHLEKRNTRLLDENNTMQQRISAFEKLFMHGAMNGGMSPMPQPPTPMQFAQDAFMNSPMSTPGASDPPGMIQVPEEMKRIIQAQAAAGRPYPVPPQPFQPNPALMRQQQIQQQQQMQQNRWQNAGPYFGKLMVGTLAGLMIVEAARENEQSNDETEGRGLFAVPIHLLASIASTPHFSVAGYHLSTAQVLSTLKLLVLFGALLWAFVPSLFSSKPPKPQKGGHISASLEKVPSLASPIHVRRQAWLTAIQTVWVPRHNFILEALALILKTVKLSLRNAMGLHGYQTLTGLTEEQETARVQAWTIALDAQLAGGDIEINKSRLTLTLLASGTLPDTPLRLMLKALHIRVILWQSGIRGIQNVIANKLARSKWNQAKQLYQITTQLRRSGAQVADEELPEHLAALLDQECEEVLNDDVVQRAHNLAWNNPTTFNVDLDIGGMSAVVEDPAVRSPMDAVAAWWSSLVLHRAVSTALSEEVDEATVELIKEDLDLAAATSPIGSNAQLRSLVARAVLLDEKRGSNIASALQALGPLLNPDKHPHYSKGVPPLIDSPMSTIDLDPDVEMALRCAMSIAHLQRFAEPSKDTLACIDSILPGSTEGMTLLGCTAAFKLMERLHKHNVAAEACAPSLERLAGTLRLWIGGHAGDKCGLDQDTRHNVVDRCLSVTKSLIGMDSDQGYGSMSDECDLEELTS